MGLDLFEAVECLSSSSTAIIYRIMSKAWPWRGLLFRRFISDVPYGNQRLLIMKSDVLFRGWGCMKSDVLFRGWG
jgi:hypothetical protein